MNKYIILSILFALLITCQKGEDIAPDYYHCQFNFNDSSATHPKHLDYQNLLHSMTLKGVVGVSMSVFHPETGMWLGSSGKADLHNAIDMESCHKFRFGSTVKMFTATVVLKLQEEGKLDIDDQISDYLQGDYMNQIENANQASIRQLLQHSSGIYNYIQNPKFQTASLNNLIEEWTAAELLKYAYHKSAYFEPGENVTYSNTNYILLGLLIEKIEDKPIYQVFNEKIINPLGLTSTSFAGENPIPDGTVRGYIDLYSNLNVIESTYYSGWDYYTADGGLISNPYDMNVFFRALMNGQIIQNASLNQMLDWKTPQDPDEDFFPISYGLGIFKIETDFGIAYMHSGDAIGYFATMLYFPSNQSTIVYAANSNYGKIDAFISTKEAIHHVLTVTQ
ncbi:MAG: beta-lactamase family protein [Flavobacteriaceae bacterium]|nr:beta-lactamase family protein [Flavobacteriaceae bacterium]